MRPPTPAERQEMDPLPLRKTGMIPSPKQENGFETLNSSRKTGMRPSPKQKDRYEKIFKFEIYWYDTRQIRIIVVKTIYYYATLNPPLKVLF